MPVAPRASAATSPRPSAIPPAATTGTVHRVDDLRDRGPSRPRWRRSGDGRFTHVERWPPASPPWATTTSTPDAATVRASSTVATIATTLIPRSRQRADQLRARIPEADAEDGRTLLQDRPRSARAMMSGTAAGRLADGGSPSRARNRFRTAWTAASRSSGIVAGSAGGRSSVWSHRFTPNGRSVSSRTCRMRAPQLVRRDVEPRQDAQAAGARHLGDQVRPGNASHARLEHGVLDPEQVAERSPQDVTHARLPRTRVAAWRRVSRVSATASPPRATSVSPTERTTARVPTWAIRTKPVRKVPTRLPTVDAGVDPAHDVAGPAEVPQGELDDHRRDHPEEKARQEEEQGRQQHDPEDERIASRREPAEPARQRQHREAREPPGDEEHPERPPGSRAIRQGAAQVVPEGDAGQHHADDAGPRVDRHARRTGRARRPATSSRTSVQPLATNTITYDAQAARPRLLPRLLMIRRRTVPGALSRAKRPRGRLVGRLPPVAEALAQHLLVELPDAGLGNGVEEHDAVGQPPARDLRAQELQDLLGGEPGRAPRASGRRRRAGAPPTGDAAPRSPPPPGPSGAPMIRLSRSTLEIHSPPDLMRSLVRSVIWMYPSASIVTTSPVRNQPSSVNCAAASGLS